MYPNKINKKFKSKADTLTFLQKKLIRGKVEEIFSFTVLDWKIDKKQIIRKTIDKFYPDEIIVRSSARGEDSVDTTEAGKYKSIQNISTQIKKNLENSVNEVILAYTEKENENQENQVLIQRQTTDVITNGVVFTRTPDNGSPYYVINFSDSKETDNVTKGEISNLIKIFRNCEKKIIPRVSPNKTWLGSICGFIGSFIVPLIFHSYYPIEGFLLFDYLLCGFIFGLFGQLGDLFESLLKREVNIKDTSNILHGHGGVLDRFDSLSFASPVLLIFLIIKYYIS